MTAVSTALGDCVLTLGERGLGRGTAFDEHGPHGSIDCGLTVDIDQLQVTLGHTEAGRERNCGHDHEDDEEDEGEKNHDATVHRGCDSDRFAGT